MKNFIKVLITSFVFFYAISGVGVEYGPVVGTYDDWKHIQDAGILLQAAEMNHTRRSLQVTFFLGQTLSWSWSISGDLEFGDVVAQAKWGHEIGYSETLTWSVQTNSTIPAMGDVGCGCVDVVPPWREEGVVIYEHRCLKSRRDETEAASRYRYYYDPSQNNLITRAEVIGWAQRNYFPYPLGTVCELRHFTACWPSDTFQNPFTLNQKTYYYVPAAGVYICDN